MSENTCKICGAPTTPDSATWYQDPSMTITLDRCVVCGFLCVHDNPWDYTEVGFGPESTDGPRVGSPDVPGREYHMGVFGAEVLGRPGVDVLIVGPGLSYDWAHLQRESSVGSVTVADIDNFAGSPVFVTLEELPGRRFDLVLACEVVEHLYDPMREISDILALIGDDGLFIASTNINDGTPLERHWYPFNQGHVSYYSPRSLELIAEANDAYVDFRIPKVAHQRAGKRKRYVMFTRSEQVLASTSRWFMRTPVAPSERDVREFVPPQGA